VIAGQLAVDHRSTIARTLAVRYEFTFPSRPDASNRVSHLTCDASQANARVTRLANSCQTLRSSETPVIAADILFADRRQHPACDSGAQSGFGGAPSHPCQRTFPSMPSLTSTVAALAGFPAAALLTFAQLDQGTADRTGTCVPTVADRKCRGRSRRKSA
jgi:hypothetical protein